MIYVEYSYELYYIEIYIFHIYTNNIRIYILLSYSWLSSTPRINWKHLHRQMSKIELRQCQTKITKWWQIFHMIYYSIIKSCKSHINVELILYNGIVICYKLYARWWWRVPIFLHRFCVDIVTIYFETQNSEYIATVPTYLGSMYYTIFYEDNIINFWHLLLQM